SPRQGSTQLPRRSLRLADRHLSRADSARFQEWGSAGLSSVESRETTRRRTMGTAATGAATGLHCREPHWPWLPACPVASYRVVGVDSRPCPPPPTYKSLLTIYSMIWFTNFFSTDAGRSPNACVNSYRVAPASCLETVRP